MPVRAIVVAVTAALAFLSAACSDDDASTPIIVERTDRAPTGTAGRDGCDPAARSFDADTNGRFDSADEAFFAGVSEHDIPGDSVVAVTEAPASSRYYSYSGDELRAITGVIRTGNGLWAVSGVAYCA